MVNRLSRSTSPYLLQHADNPVDWYEWGEEAFARARELDRPVFLSIGYAACHWCHVMAHESFEDDEVAARLNTLFVPVKVDREERPDVDAVYMEAVQAISGHGGWPMSVFLTPDGEPFFGGTYYPREDRGPMPGFLRVLDAVSTAWRDSRDRVVESGRQLAARLAAAQQLAGAGEGGRIDLGIADVAAAVCVQAWDRDLGGFGPAPKFPQAMTIDFLLAHSARTGHSEALEAATHSLTAMSRGGIYDHVAGGFARYATDRRWLVPHFEKMLYDNALLLPHLGDRREHADEPRHAAAVVTRPVGAGEERLAVGRQDHAHGPSAAPGQRLDSVHVDRVDVRALLTVDLDRHEAAVEQGGDLVVLERLVRHDVAPVARRVAHGQEHGPVLGTGARERIVTPFEPVDRVVGVLAQVWAGRRAEAVHDGDLPLSLLAVMTCTFPSAGGAWVLRHSNACSILGFMLRGCPRSRS